MTKDECCDKLHAKLDDLFADTEGLPGDVVQAINWSQIFQIIMAILTALGPILNPPRPVPTPTPAPPTP